MRASLPLLLLTGPASTARAGPDDGWREEPVAAPADAAMVVPHDATSNGAPTALPPLPSRADELLSRRS